MKSERQTLHLLNPAWLDPWRDPTTTIEGVQDFMGFILSSVRGSPDRNGDNIHLIPIRAIGWEGSEK